MDIMESILEKKRRNWVVDWWGTHPDLHRKVNDIVREGGPNARDAARSAVLSSGAALPCGIDEFMDEFVPHM